MRIKTLEQLNLDSTKGVYFRQAANCLISSLKFHNSRNPKRELVISAAIKTLIHDTNLPKNEAEEYVNRVISDAEDIEWNEKHN